MAGTIECKPYLENTSNASITEVKVVQFGCVPVDTVVEKSISIENTSEVSKLTCTSE